MAVPIIGYLLGPAMKKGSSYNSWVTLGPLSDFPEGETRLVNYRNPVDDLVGWADGGRSLLGAAGLRHDVSGLRDKLRASGVSGALVCAVQALPLSVPWGRLLC